MTDFFSLMGLPLLACLILTGIHAYLGLHVIERQVIFVDLSLAQIAALGAACAIFLGYDTDHPMAYGLSLLATTIGAVIFALTRSRDRQVSQEAVIGIVYAVAAALAVLILSRSPEGDEHIRQMLIGNILLVDGRHVLEMLVLYSLLGVVHGIFRKQFLLISMHSDQARLKKMPIRFWDLLFYLTFGVVVTTSVKIAGVLLVFSYLIVPAFSASLFFNRIGPRLIFGWVIGILASLGGLGFSYAFDFPTGASIVCCFGLLLVMLTGVRALKASF